MTLLIVLTSNFKIILMGLPYKNGNKNGYALPG